ncbi:MAG: class I tRNA ligase family protein [Bacteriovoracaceae bacterium]|nr:class I tRNA ligase family protein [Bacteriovoracaceae bacterium]
MGHQDKNTAEKNILEKFEMILSRQKFPKKAVVTAGMPYANGPLHLGHLAGAHVPADVYARFMRMLIGAENVLFVCGTDDHGSTSEVAAKKQGLTTKEFINTIHSGQKSTMDNYHISLDTYTGTSREENYQDHKNICQQFLKDLHKNGRLEKRTSEQWYDPELGMFLPDRYVTGTCPNENCTNEQAYSEECDVCGKQYEANQLKNPISSVSKSTPVLKETDHWYLDMWSASNELKTWLDEKKKSWRKSIISEVTTTVMPTLLFTNKSEPQFKEIKENLPSHKSRYAPGRKVAVAFDTLADLEEGKKQLEKIGIECELDDSWAHRSITRDVPWGIPVPEEIDPSMKGKTLYVWPESLIAPISFSRVALKKQGRNPDDYKSFWCDPDSQVFQFLGQDNVFFYVLMQGAMWFGTQKDPLRQPIAGELQLTDIFSSYHLQINGEKMSKSKGNFYTGDQLLENYHPDQIRYFLSILSLTEKNSNFDEETLKQRNAFLAGPLNAAFEKPISACHSKFNGVIPDGKLIGKTEKETLKLLPNYMKMMQKADYAKILFAVENYARVINSLFSQFKPHDDRHDETERKDALYSCFYILKNLTIMLYPFAPETIDKLRVALNLPEDIYQIKELARPLKAGHKIGEQGSYFPAVDED